MSDETIRSTDQPATTASSEQETAAAAAPSSTVPNKGSAFAFEFLRRSTRLSADETGYESECSTSSRSEADVALSALEVEAEAYRRFIERQRMDVMYELRRIRLGERPVTGQPNRERIETFINTIHENQQEPARVPSRRPVVPSAHMADINSLASRRCVSAALTSVAFRQDLENTIRQSIGIRASVPVPTPAAHVSSTPPRVPSPMNVEPPPPAPTPAAIISPLRPEPTPIALNIER